MVTADCYYFRLRVANTGERRAEFVEVFVGDLHDKNGVLIRRYSLDLKWMNLGVSRLKSLSAGMERFCDIGHIIEVDKRKEFTRDNESDPTAEASKTLLCLDLEARPNNLIHLLRPGEYKLGLMIAAANCKPIRRTLCINLVGSWHNSLEKMCQDGIQIELK